MRGSFDDGFKNSGLRILEMSLEVDGNLVLNIDKLKANTISLLIVLRPHLDAMGKVVKIGKGGSKIWKCGYRV